MRQTKRESGEILKELTKAEKRIAAEKKDLKKELAKLEAEQQSEKPKGFTLSNVMQSSRTSEENTRLIESIRAALDLPYYADSEYRKLSIEFMEAVAEEAAAAYAKKQAELEEAEKAAKEAKERLERLEAEKNSIFWEATDTITKADNSGALKKWRDRPISYIIGKYEELCSRYE